MKTKTSITTAILTPQGIKRTPYRASSLMEAEALEPHGVYTVARTYHTIYTLKLAAHFDRLEHSAHLIGMDITLDRALLRAQLREILQQAGHENGRFRLTVPDEQPAHIYLALETLPVVPANIRAEGAHVITVAAQRSNPAAKSTAWMGQRAELQAQINNGIYAGILTDSNNALLEGFGSNFYAIIDGVLYTARENILPGISRQIVLTVAPTVLPVQETPVTLADLPRLDEAFLTSSSRGVVPIVQINDQVIGLGTPGPFTRQIEQNYNDWSEDNLEPI